MSIAPDNNSHSPEFQSKLDPMFKSSAPVEVDKYSKREANRKRKQQLIFQIAHSRGSQRP
jgi:hypothetical protein